METHKAKVREQTDKETEKSQKENKLRELNLYNQAFLRDSLNPAQTRYRTLDSEKKKQENRFTQCDLVDKPSAYAKKVECESSSVRGERDRCNRDLTKCNTDKTNQNAKLTEEKRRLSDIIRKYNTCLSDLNRCLLNRDAKKQQYEQEKSNYEQTRIRLPYKSCSVFEQKKGVNDKYIQKCNDDVADVEKLNRDLQAIKKDLAALDDQCQNIQPKDMDKYSLDHLIGCGDTATSCDSCAKICKPLDNGSGVFSGRMVHGNTNRGVRNACICTYRGKDGDRTNTDTNNMHVYNWIYSQVPYLNYNNTNYPCAWQNRRAVCEMKNIWGYGVGKILLSTPDDACLGKKLYVDGNLGGRLYC
jgi:hypothetical protein